MMKKRKELPDRPVKILTAQEEHVLLAVCQLGENAYLITVKDFLKERTGKDRSIGSIYVPLDRLWKMGYLTTRIGEPSAKVGGRSIKYYRLTPEGKQMLAEQKKIHERLWMGYGEKKIFEDG